MFCGCPVAFGGEPNTRVCPVCLGLPGALPVPNERAVECTVLAGLATNCDIALWSQFHRKNYFYPDMPKDYQISQYDLPFCSGGLHRRRRRGRRAPRSGSTATARSAPMPRTAYTTRIGITRIHLEEDTGKMIHVGGTEGRIAGATRVARRLQPRGHAAHGARHRAGHPHARGGAPVRAEAAARSSSRSASPTATWRKARMRVDANVSVRPRGETELGTKAEVKNMNSFKALHDALAYEIVRQADAARGGRRGRAGDAPLGRRRQAHEHAAQQGGGARLPLLPRARHGAVHLRRRVDRARRATACPSCPTRASERFIAELRPAEARRRRCSSDDRDARRATSRRRSTIAGRGPREGGRELGARRPLGVPQRRGHRRRATSRVTPAMLAELVGLVEDGTISGKQAKEVFAEMVATGDAAGRDRRAARA